MKSPCLALLIAALLGVSPASAAPQLQYVVIVSRHGVRSPTWETARLNQYSAEPWPDWGVPPGNLTPHGRKLIELMGGYYHDWLAQERLVSRSGCQDAGRVYIWADKDQRTIETGRAFARSLLPGCEIPVHSQPAGSGDPLFSGLGTLDPERARTAVKERLGSDPQKLLTEHKAALEALQFLLNRPNPAADIGVSLEGKSVELTGPFAIGSTFSENLLLEYTNGMQGKSLGWGRLTKENLHQVLELHAVYADLMRRTPYLARVRGSNLLAQVLHSLEQAETGRETAGALGRPGDAVLLISGHDTNLSNLSGMLGLSWSLPGYQADDTPPGGALIFSLWHDAEAGRDFVKLRYTAQTLDQMRNGEPLSLESPPAGQEVTLPGCPAVATGGCPWEAARAVLQKAIDPTAAGVR